MSNRYRIIFESEVKKWFVKEYDNESYIQLIYHIMYSYPEEFIDYNKIDTNSVLLKDLSVNNDLYYSYLIFDIKGEIKESIFNITDTPINNDKLLKNVILNCVKIKNISLLGDASVIQNKDINTKLTFDINTIFKYNKKILNIVRKYFTDSGFVVYINTLNLIDDYIYINIDIHKVDIQEFDIFYDNGSYLNKYIQSELY